MENKIEQSTEPLKAFDYACGSGHFLTEYAHQIKPLVEKYKQIEVSKYYENIVGIEKEDRLAKIAKVSAYMYGQDQIKIIEEDALSNIEELKEENFDVLITNPPFAVEGFLLNLSDKEKEQYELINTTELNSNTNNIQCFFIERAKQMIAPDGVVGIIVPSSILSNSDATHIATREIILKYFDTVALVELGSGTFGKTGTNTVVLFLKRKAQRPEPAEHYANRVEDYFEGDGVDSEYQDEYLIKKYCEHNELPFNEYKKLFDITAENMEELNELFKTDIFATYKKEFENSTEIKNLKKKKSFKEKTKEKQQLDLDKRLIKYLYKIEKDKLYYFMLAYENKQKVLIIKSPSNNKEQKKFLGYEWSGAKGQEGIKYIGGDTVNDIITPLFNPKDRNDQSKISYLIQQNFLGKEPIDLSDFEQYKELITYANVTDLLDFSRKDFNKAFSLSPKRNIMIETKWDLVKLGEVVDLLGGFAFKSADYIEQSNTLNFRQANIRPNGIIDLNYKKTYLPDNFYEKYKEYALKDGDVVIAMTDMNKELNLLAIPSIIKTDGYNLLLNQRVGKFFDYDLNRIIPSYLNEVLKSTTMRNVLRNYGYGNVQSNLSKNDLLGIKIPLPPKEIQEKIVSECKAIDQEVEKAQETIEQAEKEIENGFAELLAKANKTYKLNNSDIFEVSIGKRVVAKEIENTKEGIPVYSANVFEPFGYINKTLLKDFSKPSVLWGIDGDWMVNYIEKDKPFYPTDHCGILRVKGKEIDPRYLTFALEKAGKEVRFSRNHRASIDRIKGLTIKTPDYKLQKQFADNVEKLEIQIKQAREVINQAKEKKQAILDKYLK